MVISNNYDQERDDRTSDIFTVANEQKESADPYSDGRTSRPSTTTWSFLPIQNWTSISDNFN